ncbi:MAG: hypothetical protein QOD07_2033 [Frankiaceae bacterium]|jgi:FAD/FMN-containing dehydrogenase|nr:hypothetical protein [Frankiaceae bacterium]
MYVEVRTALVDQLVSILDAKYVLTDRSILRTYEADWTGRFIGTAEVVAVPGCVDEVANVLAACHAAARPVVLRGGGTGLVGGSVPEAGSVVLDLRRLVDLSVDSDSRLATAGAGVTLANLSSVARHHGLDYAIDLASRSSATVGGTIATNAGGLRVLRHGDTRAQVVGIEAVLADGSVVSHLPGVTRDNTGYHLPSLLCGSEGTLAVITKAQLRLISRSNSTAVALVAFGSAASAARAAWSVAREPQTTAVELIQRQGLDLVCRATGLPTPFTPLPHSVLLIEVASESPEDALHRLVQPLPGVVDAAVALDIDSANRLWAYRDRHTESIATLGTAHKLDVTLPASTLVQFLDGVTEAVLRVAPGAAVWLFGHIADGNVHVNITGVAPDDDSVDDAVLQQVAELGGSISTEHGIGRAKLRWLALSRTPTELQLFRTIKAAFDPQNLLNPGVLLAKS